MPLLSETILTTGTVVTIELSEDGSYRLAFGELVVYEDGRRRVRGRSTPYQTRSVEQLRYDFERDVESVGGSLA
jgi:hypothetical protein